MFNLYIYLFLLIINFSFAGIINSCSDLSLPGAYTLDKIIINGKQLNNKKLIIITGAKQTNAYSKKNIVTNS